MVYLQYVLFGEKRNNMSFKTEVKISVFKFEGGKKAVKKVLLCAD